MADDKWWMSYGRPRRIRKSINNEPEKYFTEDVMEQLESAVAKEFKYGSESNDDTEVQTEA